MSRLLFAAARGARVQLKVNQNVPWSAVHSGFIPIFESVHYRIHPEDEAYQYGPISTALREIGLTGTCDDVDIPYVKPALLLEDGYGESTEEQRRVFCLILAEALADSGL